jgi:negative regulator of flagellin synthesis FlgM
MKVDSSPDSYIGSVAGGPQKTPEKTAASADMAAAGTTTAKPQGVTVTLSPSTVSAMGSGGNEVFNSEKVEAMKQAIASGTFQVNAEAIADKMLANAAEMLNGSRA